MTIGTVGAAGGGRVTSAALDAAFGSTRGSILYRGASGWALRAPVTPNYLLVDAGPGADPAYTPVSTLLDATLGNGNGQLATRAGGSWGGLLPGAANTILYASGAGNPLNWSTITGLLDSVFGGTRGMILVRGASAWVALAAPANGQVLGSSGADPAWVGGKFSVRLELQTDQVIATGTETALAFGAGSEAFDNGNCHDTVTNNTRITIPAGGGGRWLFQAGIDWAPSNVGTRQTYLKKNGSRYLTIAQDGAPPAATAARSNATAIEDCVAGDYVECIAVHNRGSNLNAQADTWTFFAGALLNGA